MTKVGYRHTEATKLKMSRAQIGKKRIFTDEHRRNLSRAATGNPKYGHSLTPERIQMLYQARKAKYKPHTLETRRKMALAHAGSKNPQWRGGRKKPDFTIRRSLDYRLWREAVFSRDDFCCSDCGDRGVYLEADHLLPFAYYPSLRFDVDNGQTVCRSCHLRRHQVCQP